MDMRNVQINLRKNFYINIFLLRIWGGSPPRQ